MLEIDSALKRKSVFLLGPRQTGKSTFLKAIYPKALYVNLLRDKEYQSYMKDPGRLEETVAYFLENSQNRVVIIDEIQRIPQLLDEVHHLIEKHKDLRFILTGSSARKLKKNNVNLLGGRATRFHMYPLCFPELNFNFKKWQMRLQRGALPAIVDSKDFVSDLKDYVALYLREEIQAEGLSRSIKNFSRFLDFAALVNAEQVNYTSLGSDAQLSPSTVRDYFEILEDTLIGSVLPAFLMTTKRKAVTSGKFYLFDCGVVNSILGRTDVATSTPEYGKMLEQALYIEIKTYLDYKKVDKKIEYWRSTSQFEVDFLIFSNTNEIVAIEVKSSANPSKKDFKGLIALSEEFDLKRKLVVSGVDAPRKTEEGIEILPVEHFLRELWSGKYF
jgi:predicted AAA+ superfamily ATPase